MAVRGRADCGPAAAPTARGRRCRQPPAHPPRPTVRATVDPDPACRCLPRRRAGQSDRSGEVEAAAGPHAGALESAVVAAADNTRGECPVAIVVLKPDALVTAKELRAFCRERVAAHKVPRKILFRDALPKGGTGKILKAELREPFWIGLQARVH